jgi:predicted TIM-barrel fold metal-dependent hydrolase
MPATLYPPVPPSSREFYPIYAKCIELGIPVMLNVGFAGPRVPSGVQHPMHIDEVAWFFPELRIVMKHGGMPWADVCVSLLRKWPNVFYTTSGLAPKRYPREVVEYMASARQHKVIYGGYFPHIDFARSFAELCEIPLSDERAARLLRDNAAQVFAI